MVRLLYLLSIESVNILPLKKVIQRLRSSSVVSICLVCTRPIACGSIPTAARKKGGGRVGPTQLFWLLWLLRISLSILTINKAAGILISWTYRSTWGKCQLTSLPIHEHYLSIYLGLLSLFSSVFCSFQGRGLSHYLFFLSILCLLVPLEIQLFLQFPLTTVCW